MCVCFFLVCLPKLYTQINVYKCIFTYIHASSFKKNDTKNYQLMLAKTVWMTDGQLMA